MLQPYYACTSWSKSKHECSVTLSLWLRRDCALRTRASMRQIITWKPSHKNFRDLLHGIALYLLVCPRQYIRQTTNIFGALCTTCCGLSFLAGQTLKLVRWSIPFICFRKKTQYIHRGLLFMFASEFKSLLLTFPRCTQKLVHGAYIKSFTSHTRCPGNVQNMTHECGIYNQTLYKHLLQTQQHRVRSVQKWLHAFHG